MQWAVYPLPRTPPSTIRNLAFLLCMSESERIMVQPCMFLAEFLNTKLNTKPRRSTTRQATRPICSTTCTLGRCCSLWNVLAWWANQLLLIHGCTGSASLTIEPWQGREFAGNTNAISRLFFIFLINWFWDAGVCLRLPCMSGHFLQICTTPLLVKRKEWLLGKGKKKKKTSWKKKKDFMGTMDGLGC